MLSVWIVNDLFLRIYLDGAKVMIESDRGGVCVKRDEIAPLVRALGLALLYLKTEQDAGPTDGAS